MSRLVAVLALASVFALSLAAGNQAFRAGRYDEAVAEYRRAIARGYESPELRYNLGTALLRLGRHAEARAELESAAAAGEPRVQQPAHYNAGNTDLEPSFVAEASPERSAALRRAIAHYRQALLLEPTDADAKWNLELAQRLLAQQGGGGEDEDDPQQGGGGGGSDRDSPAQSDPDPAPGAGAGAQPQMTQAEAEQVLRQAAERERELQQEKLRRTTTSPPNVRDW